MTTQPPPRESVITKEEHETLCKIFAKCGASEMIADLADVLEDLATMMKEDFFSSLSVYIQGLNSFSKGETQRHAAEGLEQAAKCLYLCQDWSTHLAEAAAFFEEVAKAPR